MIFYEFKMLSKSLELYYLTVYYWVILFFFVLHHFLPQYLVSLSDSVPREPTYYTRMVYVCMNVLHEADIVIVNLVFNAVE